jgi:hypothetical protein
MLSVCSIFQQESNGLHAYITHSPSSTHPCSCLDDASFLRELHHALQYSTFPHSPFTKNHPLTGPFQLAVAKAQELHSHADKLALQYVTKVWIQWEDSFRSLYYRLRLPPHSPSYVDYFYTVHRSPYAFTVLFLAADEDSKASAITALVSRSNKVFRTALQKAGVQYTMPNSTRGERADAAAAAAAASVLGANPQEMDDATIQARLQQQKEDKLEKDEDMTAASVLLIQGRERVHCLYDFLLHQDRRELNVPTLLASTVFLNSTLQSLNIVRVGAQTKMAAGGTGTLQRQESLTKSASMFGAFSPMAGQGGGANALVKEYALDITGPILPASAVRMFSLLARTQKSNFTAHLSSDYPGMNLNCVEKAVQMDALRNQPSLGLCTQKALRTSTVTYLHGKQPVSCIGALRRVKCEVAENGASRFLVDLNTNPVS